MNPYQELISKRRKWTPVQTTKGKLVDGSEETIKRILAIRCLELPVAEFIRDGMEGDYPQAAKQILELNITDEENHDVALNYASIAIGHDTKAEQEAQSLKQAWEDHKDHTLCKAMVLERSIFFCILPFLRANGDVGLRTTSADISRDERLHVATNSLICAELGLVPSQSLDRLRKATFEWIFQPLMEVSNSKNLSKNFWRNSSDNLMYQGKAPELSFTKAARMPAFFETSNVNLPSYA